VLDSLRSRGVQIGALALAVLVASSAVSTSLSPAVRVGRGIGLVIFALILACLTLVWKRPTRGLIPVLALILVAPIVVMNRDEQPRSREGLARDLHLCYQRAIEAGARRTSGRGGRVYTERDQQEIAYGYVNECLLVQGWSDAERAAVMLRP